MNEFITDIIASIVFGVMGGLTSFIVLNDSVIAQVTALITYISILGYLRVIKIAARDRGVTDVTQQVGKVKPKKKIAPQYEYVPSNGLFDVRVTKILGNTETLQDKIEKVMTLPYVKSFQELNGEITIDMSVPRYGVIKVFLLDIPHGKRSYCGVEKKICLGNALKLYKQQLRNENYYECLRIIHSAIENGGIMY